MSDNAKYATKVCSCGFIFGMIFAIEYTRQQTLVFAILYAVLWPVVGAVVSCILFAALDALCEKYEKFAMILCFLTCVVVGTLCIYYGYKL